MCQGEAKGGLVRFVESSAELEFAGVDFAKDKIYENDINTSHN